MKKSKGACKFCMKANKKGGRLKDTITTFEDSKNVSCLQVVCWGGLPVREAPWCYLVKQWLAQRIWSSIPVKHQQLEKVC